LGGAVLEKRLDGFLFGHLLPEVEELAAVLDGVVHVGIVKEGSEIVFLAAHAEALEVDDEGLVIVQHQVLGLEVAMNHVGCGGTETFRQAKEEGIFAECGSILAEVGLDEVFEKIFLFPAVEGFVENGLEFEVLGRAGVEQFVELFESGAVIGLTLFERGVLEAEEVVVAEVFDEGDVAADVVVEDAGDIESGFAEEFGDREEVGVVGSFEGVVHADEAGVVVGSDANDGASGGSLLDGFHENPMSRGEVKVRSDGGEEGIGGHWSNAGTGLEIGIVVDA